MSSVAIAWSIGGLIAILCCLFIRNIHTTSHKRLTEWARANQFTILNRHYRWLWVGPYQRQAGSATVWLVQVHAAEEREDWGWVRIPFFGWETIHYRWDGI